LTTYAISLRPSDELRTKRAEVGHDAEGTRLPGGYRLPEGTTMTDVRRLEVELLASEGLKIEDLQAEDGRKGDSQEQ